MECHCSGACCRVHTGTPALSNGESPQRYSHPSSTDWEAPNAATGTQNISQSRKNHIPGLASFRKVKT